MTIQSIREWILGLSHGDHGPGRPCHFPRQQDQGRPAQRLKPTTFNKVLVQCPISQIPKQARASVIIPYISSTWSTYILRWREPTAAYGRPLQVGSV